MKNIFLLLAFILSSAFCMHAAVYNVKDYGAKGDGKNIDSDAINKAIEEAGVNGGGTVVFPSGTYLSFSIRLKSNITLQLDNGARILAAFPEENRGYDNAEANADDMFQDFGHSHWKNSLIWGIGLENITIEGQGYIEGMGLSREESRISGVGNKAVSLKECKNVLIRDIRMLHCGHFALLATGVENMTLHNIWVDTNRDGFDIDCCRNVRITDCSVNSPWDDAIVLKASYGLGYFKDTEDVTISNCYVSGFDQGSVLNGTYQTDEPQAPDQARNAGRIKLGTESSGGFKNISISNCIFEHCRGLALEAVDGGSLEDVVVSNITMRDIVNSPIFLRLGARQRSPKGTPLGKIKRVTISNVNVYNADSKYASIISGVPGASVEDVSLNNIRISYQGGAAAEDAALVPTENEKDYPEPLMFGKIPASGFFIRHVKNIEFTNVKLTFQSPDFRPSLWLQDVQGFRLVNYVAPVEKGVEPIVEKENVTGVELVQSRIGE